MPMLPQVFLGPGLILIRTLYRIAACKGDIILILVEVETRLTVDFRDAFSTRPDLVLDM